MLNKWLIGKLKDIKNRLNGSKDGKALTSNFGYMMLLQVAGYVFPLITLPYLARIIGVEGFGKIAFAAAIIVWFQTITDWGFNYTATREVAQNRENKERVSEIFSNVLWARMLLMLLSLCLLLIAIPLIPILEENRLIILLTFLLIPGHILFPEWFFQAVEKMRFITMFSLASKLLFATLVFSFVKEKEDFILQPIFMSVGYLLCGIASMYLIIVRWKVRIHPPRWRAVALAINKSTDVFLVNIMPNLYYGFSTLLVGFFGGAISNGILDAGRKLVGVGEQFMNTISRVFYPYLARNGKKHGLYAKINISISLIMCLVLSISAPILIEILFTSEFSAAVPVLQISSLSLIFLSLRNIYGINYLILRGQERASRDIIACTSLLGFLISFPLIYLYDYIGAAIVAVFIHALQGGLMMIAAKRFSKKISAQ